MGYVENNLMPNEHVVAYGKLHWWIFASGATTTFIGLLFIASFYLNMGNAASILLGIIFLFTGVFMLISAYIKTISTELAVTNKRIIAKFGLIRRSTLELRHEKVESFHVDQGVIGRILNFGTVVINGTGGAHTPIPRVSKPLEFRKSALSAIDI